MNNGNGVKYLSFSLWGEEPKYTVGAIRNAELAREIYPDWHMVVYHDDSVPKEILNELHGRGVRLINMTESPIYGLFWRFLAADCDDCEYAIFRDTDSRLSIRERRAVDEWVQQGKILHIMRDHPHHQVPFGAEEMGILGGMWGIKGGAIQMKPLIRNFITEKGDEYGVDQDFLQQIYRQFSNSKTVHDEFFEKKPFPVKRSNYRFVGERIDELEQPIGDDWKVLKRYLSQRKLSWFKRIKRKLFNKK